jgi:hypothetical protein
MLVNTRSYCQIGAHARRLLVVGLALGTFPLGCSDRESEAKVSALEAKDVAAYWAIRGKDREGNNFIHPVVRFRVANRASDPVGYVQAMAVFKREKFPDEPWGNDFLYSISDEPIPAGGSSDVLTMRSDTNVISKDAPEQMFQNDKWEDVDVAVFLRVGPSSWKPFLEIGVPKKIGAPGVEKFIDSESPTVPLPEKP